MLRFFFQTKLLHLTWMLDQIKLGTCHHGKLCSGDARATIIVRMNTYAPSGAGFLKDV